MVWVPWRVWIERMSTAEFRFQWVNPLHQLRKIWKRTTNSSNGTNGSKTEDGKNTVQKPAIPRQSTAVSGETIVANPGASTSHKESIGKEGEDKNRERPEAPVEDRVEVAVLLGASTSDQASTDNTESIQVCTNKKQKCLYQDNSLQRLNSSDSLL